MKLGIYLPMFGGWIRDTTNEEPEVTFNYIQKSALLAEEVGFHSIWIADHLLNPLKGVYSPCYEAWTIVSALAALTRRIILSHVTLCQGFRNPALLAKMSSTLQEITGGRFILTLGAGWDRREFEAYGFEWQEHDTRIAQTREQVEIIKSLWTKPVTNYEGSYYSIREGILEPKPSPVPEVWYGGESDASKKLVASLADGWLLYPSPLDEIVSKIHSLNSLLKGRSINYVASSHVVIDETDEKAKEKLRKITGGDSKLMSGISRSGMVGSIETIKNKMDAIEDSGIDILLLRFSRTIEDLPLFADSLL